MHGIKIPPQDFVLKMQGELTREGRAYLRDTTVYTYFRVYNFRCSHTPTKIF